MPNIKVMHLLFEFVEVTIRPYDRDVQKPLLVVLANPKMKSDIAAIAYQVLRDTVTNKWHNSDDAKDDDDDVSI